MSRFIMEETWDKAFPGGEWIVYFDDDNPPIYLVHGLKFEMLKDEDLMNAFDEADIDENVGDYSQNIEELMEANEEPTIQNTKDVISENKEPTIEECVTQEDQTLVEKNPAKKKWQDACDQLLLEKKEKRRHAMLLKRKKGKQVTNETAQGDESNIVEVEQLQKTRKKKKKGKKSTEVVESNIVEGEELQRKEGGRIDTDNLPEEVLDDDDNDYEILPPIVDLGEEVLNAEEESRSVASSDSEDYRLYTNFEEQTQDVFEGDEEETPQNVEMQPQGFVWKVEAYQRAYNFSVFPIPNDIEWNHPQYVVKPPPLERPTGRPKGKRIRGEDEPQKTTNKVR
ncbi:hypothetical protein FRX31_030316, partial [Thalictrum thalictroides]